MIVSPAHQSELTHQFTMENSTLKTIELSLGVVVHINVHKYEFMQAPMFKKIGELSFSTTKDKGLIFYHGSQKKRSAIFSQGTDCGWGYLGKYLLEVKREDENVISFSCGKWVGKIEKITRGVYMTTFENVRIKITVSNFLHKVCIQLEGGAISYDVPMALNPDNPLIFLQNLLSVLTFGLIRRSNRLRLIPPDFHGCIISNLGIILSVTILRLIYYNSDFDQNWH